MTRQAITLEIRLGFARPFNTNSKTVNRKMENNVPQKLQSNSGISILTPNTVLREQPKNEAAKTISAQLDKLARLFQIPNWDQMNTVLLTEWIMDTYPNELTETIISALSRPRIDSKVWRLTPDTITEWMQYEIEREAQERERQVHNAKQEEFRIEWTDQQFKEIQEAIDKAEGFKAGQRMSDKEVMQEGQTRPKWTKPTYTSAEYIRSRELHLQWIRENFDPITAQKKATWISEEEWNTRQH